MTEQSYAELLAAGAEKLQNSGLDNPRAEARRLLCLAADLDAAALISLEHDPVASEHQTAYQDLLQKRSQRVPFAHLAKRAAFYGLDLISDQRALIPRADSECVVDLALEQIPADAAWSLADLGTGSGALLAALLTQRPKAHGIAVEQNQEALALARENFDALGLSDRIDLIAQSWTDWSSWSDCALIISNPPYICSHVIPDLAPEVREHDPLDALDGGEDGLDAYRSIIALGAANMPRDAHLVLEIGYDQKVAVSALLEAAGFSQIHHRQDLGGNDRAIAARKT